MDKNQIVEIIVETIDGYRLSADGQAAPTAADTRLFGPEGVLDSLGLVSVLVELEQEIADRAGSTISLMDDRAMSESASPFRTVQSLADYIARQMGGGAA
jgi:acyl carrier protein